jgi:hypothetical protein
LTSSAPIAPDKSSLLQVNTSFALISLSAFHDGACSITSFDVLYKRQRSHRWISLMNGQNLQQLDHVLNDEKQQEKTLILTDLDASTVYDLKITAHNQAGSTEAQYSFSTEMIVSHGNIIYLGVFSSRHSSNLSYFI